MEVPDGEWVLTLRTTWVEPAYLEPDASWCAPGGIPATPLANGGAFGGKRRSPLPALARELADEHDHPVRVLWSRETVVRHGGKRPPVALGVRADGSGVMRVARTPGSADLGPLRLAVAAQLPGLVIEEVALDGPPVVPDVRGAGWAEAAAVRALLPFVRRGVSGPGHPVEVARPGAGRAVVTIDEAGEVHVEVWAGEVLDEVTLRSYCLGAVHQALSWVRREGIAVDDVRRGAGPDDPLVRHPVRARHSGGARCDPPLRRGPGERVRRGLRRHRRRRLAGRRSAPQWPTRR